MGKFLWFGWISIHYKLKMDKRGWEKLVTEFQFLQVDPGAKKKKGKKKTKPRDGSRKMVVKLN